MEQIFMEILEALKTIAIKTQALELLRIGWIIGLCAFGWKSLCSCVKAVISVVRYAKDKDEYADDDDEEDDIY